MARLKSKLHLTIILLVFFTHGALASKPSPAGISRNIPKCNLPLVRTATVAQVLNDGLLQLESGERVRLIGTMPVRYFKNPTSPMAKKLNRLALQALEFIRNEVEHKKIKLHQQGRSRDRYDHLLAHVFGERGQWLQGLLLQKGLARTYSYRDNRMCIKQMLTLEAMARNKRRGLWKYRTFQPKSALQTKLLSRRRYRFTLVEGSVRKVAIVKGWDFLNFGENWRTDFTIAIKRKYHHQMQRNGFDPEQLAGRKIRVRGWIEYWNGPLIKITHKEQIEILDDQSDNP